MPGSGEHESKDMEHDVERERSLSLEELKEQERSARERINRLMGADKASSSNATYRAALDDIKSKDLEATSELAGTMAMDAVESRPFASGWAADFAADMDRAIERAREEGNEKLKDKGGKDGEQSKKSYARTQFWGMLIGGVAMLSSLASNILAGFALRPTRPDDPDYDARVAAREQFNKWKSLPGPQFWKEVGDYVLSKRLSLATQGFLMHYVSVYFSGDYVKLEDGEVARLRDVLVTAYQDAVGMSPSPPSSAIYATLATGLKGKEAATGHEKELVKPQCAAIAQLALSKIIKTSEIAE
ncbi:hypothetical protein [Dyella sp. EPa41]|uniref:hypothetical protein n=1 Tax=Dyella sp. EPa41 TaxID=1561194 RepID=UPI001915B3D7|nr:hypothetical protein [Dyella sp. EPa41]